MKISCVIPTRNRPTRLRATLRSLAGQPGAPEEIIVVDGSDDAEETARLQAEFAPHFPRFRAVRAEQTGAAIQRNQGVALAAGEWIGFCDDDLDFEPGCLQALRAFLGERSEFGGVSATITNQAPRGFGRATRAVVGLMDAHRERPLDGRVVGPALNFLPAVRAGAPAVCEAEWLNTTCTIYRRAVLPAPPFDAEFQGYSMLEDVCLSARVAARTRLAVLRDARVFHDTQPGSHKRDPGAVARMNVRNRFYVATRVLGRPPLQTWMQLAFWQTFSAVAGLRQARHGWLKPNCGAAAALVTIALGKK